MTVFLGRDFSLVFSSFSVLRISSAEPYAEESSSARVMLTDHKGVRYKQLAI